jgi:hypothetical protein
MRVDERRAAHEWTYRRGPWIGEKRRCGRKSLRSKVSKEVRTDRNVEDK